MINLQNNTSSNINNNSNFQATNQIFIEIILNNIEKILSLSDLNENEEFIRCIFNTIPKLEELVNYYIKNNNDWRLIKKISFILKCDHLYKINNVCIDHYILKIFNIAKKLFVNDCFEIRTDSVKIMAKISKSKIIWEDVLKFVEVEILTSKNFYNRRLYLNFFEELAKSFSYKYLFDKGQIEQLMKLINDNNQILPKLLKLIKNFFPLVMDDKIKFMVFSKLEVLRKKIQNNEVNDKELIEVK